METPFAQSACMSSCGDWSLARVAIDHCIILQWRFAKSAFIASAQSLRGQASNLLRQIGRC